MEAHTVKLLLVEDNEAAASSLQRLLSKARFLSFGVTRDEYLKSALMRLRHPRDGQFDVILLDINLPDSIGVDTVTAVYREVPEVPIVVLSGQEDIKIADMALQCGAMDFVVKKSPPEYNERDIVDELERIPRIGVVELQVAPQIGDALVEHLDVACQRLHDRWTCRGSTGLLE